ncbi:MAG: TetR/AcrR family transcriptional regulator [Acidimicrobiales bacterium]|nr:TetR/AcrR family transcriptional regulator [Acidimicrobiales bacterium]
MTPATETEAADLRQVLQEATAEVIVERGLGAFSLREVARRAGVSHAAPGYHFGDMEGLLTALAIEGLDTLHRQTAAAAAMTTDPIERLRLIGVAYVQVGMNFPAHMEVAFRPDVVDGDHPSLQTCGTSAFGVLEDAVRDIAETHNPKLDVRKASHLCWSAMQGLVELHPKLTRLDEMSGVPGSSIDDLVSSFTSLLVTGFLHADD